MKILYIHQAFAKMAGTERILIDKMHYLSEKFGYDVHVLTYEQGNHPLAFSLPSKVKWMDIGVKLYPIYQCGGLRRIYRYIYLRKKFRKELTKQIKKIRPDIVICTTYAFCELGIISHAAKGCFKILESHVNMQTIGKRFNHQDNKLRYLVATIQDKLLLKNISKFDTIVVLTKQDAANWKSWSNVNIIPNILTYYPSQGCIYAEKKRVICAGRLTQQKGFDLLIQSWKTVYKQHPDWKLDIYGEGDIEEEKNILLRQIEECGLKNTIHIYNPTEQIYSEYMKSDFYVLSSRWEGFGLVLIEAMSCGVPCISFDCPYGPSDIIKNNEDGLLVENGNIQQMAEKICYLIENPSIREQMGKKARENVRRYLPDRIMGQWNNLFESLIASR